MRDNGLLCIVDPPGAWYHQSNLIRLAPPADSGGEPAKMIDAGHQAC